MSHHEDTGTQAIFASRQDAITHQLLRLGLGTSSRPIDTLLERLTRADGSQWLARVLAEEPFFGREALLDPAIEPAALDALKSASKKLTKGEGADRPLAMLAYFLAVAAAQVRHDRMLSSRPAGEVGPILADLAAALPADLAELCRQAAARMSR